MPSPFSFLIIFFFLSLSSSPLPVAGGKHESGDPASDIVRSSCVHANYPTICLRTLSSYSGPAKTPRDLALAAVNVTLARATKVSKYLNRIANANTNAGASKRQRSALSDCVEQIGDTVNDLSKSLSELQHLRGETFRWQMSNAETWVSAALTNEDTCLDGFQDVGGKLKVDVNRKITNVAMVTSNALYMINRLEETRGEP